jgi:hypothetical protein
MTKIQILDIESTNNNLSLRELTISEQNSIVGGATLAATANTLADMKEMATNRLISTTNSLSNMDSGVKVATLNNASEELSFIEAAMKSNKSIGNA